LERRYVEAGEVGRFLIYRLRSAERRMIRLGDSDQESQRLVDGPRVGEHRDDIGIQADDRAIRNLSSRAHSSELQASQVILGAQVVVRDVSSWFLHRIGALRWWWSCC
jgi:hypothetical protein